LIFSGVNRYFSAGDPSTILSTPPILAAKGIIFFLISSERKKLSECQFLMQRSFALLTLKYLLYNPKRAPTMLLSAFTGNM
jgi:hypothetical protein